MSAEEVPLPPRKGDRIKRFVGPGNPNNWVCFGEVRAVVDGHLVVRRWLPRKRYHCYVLIEPEAWEIGHLYYVVRRRRR